MLQIGTVVIAGVAADSSLTEIRCIVVGRSTAKGELAAVVGNSPAHRNRLE
jgi:hypothetical protein